MMDEWQDNKHRPAWVQANREALMSETGLDIPRSRSAIDEWVDDNAHVVTKKLGGEDDQTEDEA